MYDEKKGPLPTMPQIQPIPMKEADHVQEQARLIRNIAQEVMDACRDERSIGHYAYNKIMSGHLAGDAACLAVMILQYEMEQENG